VGDTRHICDGEDWRNLQLKAQYSNTHNTPTP